MIYRYIVERKLRRAFEALNRGDHAPILASFAPTVEHVFFGDHALGGSRHDMTTIEPWYARLKTVLPDLQFDIESVVVRGMPWNTVALVEWRDRFSLRDGTRAGNQGVHALRLKWGKVSSLRIYCDTQVLADVLRRQHRHGIPDAGMAPIVDDAFLAAA
jgi:ketosteroid isomerase-like protein